MKRTIVALIAVSLVLPLISFAQEKLALTLTPPLFRLSLQPGESWASSVKLVNTNDFDLTVYATTMDFTDNGGKGTPQFFPPSDDPDNVHSLGSWIDIPRAPISIPRGTTKDIPFSVHVPEGAEPGGHYGAIQIGTVPVREEGKSGVSVGSQVASLLFVRVAGAVTEEGEIRDFYAARAFAGRAEQTFSLSFENTGNVHLQPQGEIVITNMWGKVRGTVPINKETNFGNVLPSSMRTFEFHWVGEESVFDIGLYRAEVTVAYGEEARNTVFRRTYFWIIPWKPLLAIFGGLFLLLFLGVWSMRRYVSQALDLERRRLGLSQPVAIAPSVRVIAAPIGKGMSDLRRLGARPDAGSGLPPIGGGEYFWRYRFIFLTLLVFLGFGYGLYAYFASVLTSERNFSVEMKTPDQGMTIVEVPK